MSETSQIDEVDGPGAADPLADSRVERVRPAAGGHPALYRCALSADWNAAHFPFGGFVSAVGMRAMAAEVEDREHRPRALTTVFSSPVAEGSLDIEVSRLRAGRGATQLLATVRNSGSDEAGHTSLGVFGASRKGFEFTDALPPDAPDPEECDGPKLAPPSWPRWRSRFFEQLEVRQWNLHAPWETDWVGGRAEACRWMRFRVTPRLPDGSIDPIALVALCDTMPPAIGQRLGPGHSDFIAPSCDLNVHFLAPTREEWLLVEARCHASGDGYAAATVRLWDRQRVLVAHAAQLMFLRLEPGEELP